MQVVRFSTLDDLAPLAGHWNRLARGVPFRSWPWMAAWWRHYGESISGWRQRLSLFTLVVLDPSGVPVGIAPWYCRPSPSQGRVLRFLGVEKVCGDHVSLLCSPGMEEPVAAALADWLTKPAEPTVGPPPPETDGWDLLELTGVDADDAGVRCLGEQLGMHGNPVHRRPGVNCWRIELPPTWDAYLARLSKGHRKQLRRIERNLVATRRIRDHLVQRADDLDRAEQILIDLHQRRRRSLGQPGCFSSAAYLAFHAEVMSKLLAAGQLRLSWVEREGLPVAAEYHLAAEGVVYAYQSGIEPKALVHSPGQLSTLIAIRRAIRQGYRSFDFLRGDEPYKAHWRAVPRPSVEYRIGAVHPSARLRHGIWRAGNNMKQWLKTGTAVLLPES